jgi:hypothetical protein
MVNLNIVQLSNSRFAAPHPLDWLGSEIWRIRYTRYELHTCRPASLYYYNIIGGARKLSHATNGVDFLIIAAILYTMTGADAPSRLTELCWVVTSVHCRPITTFCAGGRFCWIRFRKSTTLTTTGHWGVFTWAIFWSSLASYTCISLKTYMYM